MSRDPVWRAILWVERFLPTPRQATAGTGRAAAAKACAAFVPMFVFPMIVVPTILRERHELGEIVRQNYALLAQLTLVVAGCVVLAIVAFGTKAWRDARRSR